MEFPAMLYKANGSMLEWDGEMFDYLIVDDEEEAEIALEDGWSIGKPANPLDHDGDGKAGGSPKGEEATAAKGARAKRGAAAKEA